eukprot:CAMPEP_0172316486 /NCGR_PEP_ID=MMETSP1058-20130122/28394_1 /TAXON_ID=83371 /ORGANISM="Detonula confervacea, Strain CCMP 353" /LENGTH=323 /DNA_ID=CAMNT_0013030803 /DNA_START=142 /DNA_END=1113 /DNA_ORIENTATION=-
MITLSAPFHRRCRRLYIAIFLCMPYIYQFLGFSCPEPGKTVEVESAKSKIDELRAIVEVNTEHEMWLKSSAAYAEAVGIQNILRGNVVTEQVLAYRQITKTLSSPEVAVVCETGFFRGVSAHLWMDSARNKTQHSMTLHSFDLNHPDKNVVTLRNTFPLQEFIPHTGSTRDTLPSFQLNKPCNLLSIDGSHDGWDPFLDLVDLLPNTKCGAIVLYDDTFDMPQNGNTYVMNNNPDSPEFFNACSRSYWRAVNESLVEHVDCQNFGKKPAQWGSFPKGYCLAIARGGEMSKLKGNGNEKLTTGVKEDQRISKNVTVLAVFCLGV